MHPHIFGLSLTFIANSNGAGVDLASYEDQNGLPRDYRGADAIASDVKTLTVHTISVCSIKACFPHTTSLFSQTCQI